MMLWVKKSNVRERERDPILFSTLCMQLGQGLVGKGFQYQLPPLSGWVLPLQAPTISERESLEVGTLTSEAHSVSSYANKISYFWRYKVTNPYNWCRRKLQRFLIFFRERVVINKIYYALTELDQLSSIPRAQRNQAVYIDNHNHDLI